MEQDELIPDFSEFEELTRQAAMLQGKLYLLKHQLRMFEAELITTAMLNKDYWREGKRPTVSYCERVVMAIGNTEEDTKRLLHFREGIAKTTEELQLALGMIELMKNRLELYRTMSANERKGYL